MQTTSLRTQIILPKDLRDEIDRQRRLNGESLADYIRKAAKERVEKDKKRKADLKKLADSIRNIKSTRTIKEVEEWLKEIREDRRLSDERMEKRWASARDKAHVSSR